MCLKSCKASGIMLKCQCKRRIVFLDFWCPLHCLKFKKKNFWSYIYRCKEIILFLLNISSPHVCSVNDLETSYGKTNLKCFSSNIKVQPHEKSHWKIFVAHSSLILSPSYIMSSIYLCSMLNYGHRDIYTELNYL